VWMTSLCCWVDSYFRFLNITLTIPCSPWAVCDFVTHITTSKTWARKVSTWARVFTSTLVTRFPLYPLGGFLSFVLFHTRFKPPDAFASLRIGSSGAKFLL